MGVDLRRLLADAADGPSGGMDFTDVVRRGRAYQRRRGVAFGAAVFLPLALLAGSLALAIGSMSEPTLTPADPGPGLDPIAPEGERIPASPPASPASPPASPLVAQAVEGLRVLDAQLGPLQPVYPATLPPNVHLTGAYSLEEPWVGYVLSLGEVHPVSPDELPPGVSSMERVGFTELCAVPEDEAARMPDACPSIVGERVERTVPGWRLAIVLGEPLDAAYPFTTFWRDVVFTNDPAPIASTTAEVKGSLRFPTASTAPAG